MDALALLVAGATAAAVIIVVITVFGGGAVRIVDRVAVYPTASAPQISMEAQAAQRTGPLAAVGSFLTRTLGRLLGRTEWSQRIVRDLQRADLTLTPTEYVAFRLAAIVVAIVVTWILGRTVLPSLSSPWAILGAVVIGYLIPRLYVRRRQERRLRAFNDNLAETITLIANGLRAGSSLLQSLELVSRETRPPVSTEFGRVVREVSIGLPLDAALNNLVERVHSDDLELMATAIIIQYQVGGNLSEILDTIANTIRERVRIKGEIRILTAQQRLSGYVVGFLPIGLLVLLMIIAPKFINPMFEPTPSVLGIPLGVVLLLLGGFMMLIGFTLIRRIVDIEV